MDKGAGIDLMKKIGDKVETGQILYRIYSCVPSDFQFSTALAEEDTGYSVAAITV
jgi:thymidine phosphorylase